MSPRAAASRRALDLGCTIMGAFAAMPVSEAPTAAVDGADTTLCVEVRSASGEGVDT